ARIEGCGDERVAERVWPDGLADPGPARGLSGDPCGAVPVQPPAIGSQEDRPLAALTDGQVDGPRGARRAEFVPVQPGGVRLVVQPRAADLSGRGMVEQ